MGNSFGHLFRITTWGESHGGAVGVVVDGCPPRLELSQDDIAGGTGLKNVFRVLDGLVAAVFPIAQTDVVLTGEIVATDPTPSG